MINRVFGRKMESTEDRVKAAAKFLLQSPPGEINDVLNGASDLFWVCDSICRVLIWGM